MTLRPFIVAWSLLAASAFTARWGLVPQWGGRVALAYAIGSLVVVAAMALAYRRRLRQFLAEERPDVWCSLAAGAPGVRTLRLLKWGVSSADRRDCEIRAARATGGHVLVATTTWLTSTPATCLILAAPMP